MASPIITALRHRRDLKESLLHTAQELAHLASIYGVARASYAYLALKCHCSRRTVLRHIQRLIDLGIVRKTVLWIRGNYCETNTYTFRIAWDTSRPQGGSDKTSRKLPPPEGEKKAARRDEGGNPREKTSSLREELANQKNILRSLTSGSGLWERIAEEIARLEALIPLGVAGAETSAGG